MCRSIGAALGLAAAYKPSGRRVVAVIGDGAFQIGPQVGLAPLTQGSCHFWHSVDRESKDLCAVELDIHTVF